jgi:enoyl-CoA hydratase/carnithine racemase
MSFQLIELETTDGIATLRLNRPEKRNAMSDEMRSEFIEALEMVTADKSIRALVLTGNGKGFCAGGDISGMEKRMKAPTGEIAFNGWHRQQRVHHTQSLLHTMPKPVIAAVNGPASGLGADTALACDFIVASEGANFTWSYINRGIIPDGGGMYFLPRRVGLAKAKELIFSGRKVDLEEAAQIGIVDRVTNPETLVADAQAWARELSKGSATALALGKTILNQTFETSAAQIFAQGSQAQGICYTSTEHRESVLAFLEKAAAAKNK